MIERTVFGHCMGAVSQRIGKRLGDEALAMYYAILSEELTTDEFQAGMKGIFRDHAFATWPSPAEIIARAKPAATLRAVAAWSQLEDVLRRRVVSQPLVPQLQRCGVDPLAIATFHAIGGLARWRALNDFRFDEMRAEFLARFSESIRLPEAERAQLIASQIPAVTAPQSRERLRGGPRPLLELLPTPDQRRA